ncbi:hypothetical protein GA0074694_6197 [Micromonospora inyonensis]|uniref:Uncharacterized protein n=2 Tax=Micromonospora inyonensis TaxID=47866 RepID=A0A1C6SRK7_9ACTN|nr:hypothetical protein GA0074694_4217 [Micromonospora inyonensis]SCL32211.1 hypothetical protein GA0074694_6197 [Micromonospora inyonensis]
MLAGMRWVEFGSQGWVRVNGLSDGDEKFVVIAKTKEWEGRRIIVDLVISSDPWSPGVTAGKLKAVPIGWIESAVNTPEALEWLAQRDDGDQKADPTRTALHERKREYFEQLAPFSTEEMPKLTRPDGTNPDGFYRLVAAAYVAAVASSGKPAAVIAERSEVPVATVHRWIAEARRRGFLPPARKGRAG